MVAQKVTIYKGLMVTFFLITPLYNGHGTKLFIFYIFLKFENKVHYKSHTKSEKEFNFGLEFVLQKFEL